MGVVCNYIFSMMALFQKFNPKLYMEQYVVENGLHTNPLKHLHDLYSTCGKSSLTVLEVGCGPNIMQAAIAAPYASEIVLADYAEQNLKEINEWLEGQESAHDWTPMLTHIVTEIEGKTEGAEEVTKREQLLKVCIQGVIHCDVTQDPVISDPTTTHYMKEYDVVQTFLCLESACVTKDEYTSALRRMWSLVKPGGMFILYTINRKESPDLAKYMLGTETFYNLRVSLSFVVKSMVVVGFTNINSVPVFETDFESGIKEHKTTALVSATKPLFNPQNYHNEPTGISK